MAEDVKGPQKYSTAAEEAAALDVIYKKALLADLEEQRLERIADREARKAEREADSEQRKFSLSDLRAKVQDREIKEKQLREDREAQGRTFASQQQTDANRQAVCSHRKGGKVSARDISALSIGGNAGQMAVIKHTMITGDLWVRCLRCGKTWLPPVRENYYFESKVMDVTGDGIKAMTSEYIKDGKWKGVGKQMPADGPQKGTFAPRLFAQAVLEYGQACKFETNNETSGSVICQFQKWDASANNGEGGWIDAKQDVRLATSNTNLR